MVLSRTLAICQWRLVLISDMGMHVHLVIHIQPYLDKCSTQIKKNHFLKSPIDMGYNERKTISRYCPFKNIFFISIFSVHAGPGCIGCLCLQLPRKSSPWRRWKYWLSPCSYQWSDQPGRRLQNKPQNDSSSWKPLCPPIVRIRTWQDKATRPTNRILMTAKVMILLCVPDACTRRTGEGNLPRGRQVHTAIGKLP